MIHRPMHKIITFTCLVLCIIGSTSTLALNKDKQLPYHIQSDSGEYNRPRHTTTFTGHVHITQGTTLLTGNRSVIFHAKDSNRIIKMITTGQLAHYSTLPDGKSTRLYCQAQTITYYPTTDYALLVGEAKVTQEGNILSGQRIWYNLRTQQVESLRGQSSKRNELIVAPQKPPANTLPKKTPTAQPGITTP